MVCWPEGTGRRSTWRCTATTRSAAGCCARWRRSAALAPAPREPGVRAGDRAFFAPDALYIDVVAVTAEGVTSRVSGLADDAELGEERTVTQADRQGMLRRGTLRGLPERPGAGEA